MKGWVGLVCWPIADGLPPLVVTNQLQVERRTGKVRRPETDVLPLCYATNVQEHEKFTHYVGEIDSVTTVTASDDAKSIQTDKDLLRRRIDDTYLCRRRRRKQSSPADKRLRLTTSSCNEYTQSRSDMSCYDIGHNYDINTKNCRLSIVLTATDQKPQKSLKRSYYSASRWHSGNVMAGNITFWMIFAVFDPSPLTLWINCSF